MSPWRSVRTAWRENAPALVLVGRLGVVALGVMSTIVVARAIGPEGRGETAAAIALFYIVPIVLALGVPLEVRRRAAADGQIQLGTAYRRYALSVLPAAAVIGLVLARTLLDSLDRGAMIAAIVGVSLTPVTIAWMCDVSVVLARHQFRRFLMIQLAQPSVFLLLALGVWILDMATTAAVLVCYIAGNVATAALGWWASASAGTAPSSTPLELARSGSKYSGAAIAEAASNRLDQILVLPLVGASQAGLYSVAVTVSAVPLAIGHALAGWYFTLIVSAGPGPRRESLKAEAVRVALALGAAVALALACGSPWLVRVLFGAEFGAAVVPTLIALAGSVAMIGGYVAAQALAAEGRGIAMTSGQVVALAFSVLLLLALAPAYGANGAAAASSLGYLALLVVLLVVGRWSMRSVLPRPRDVRSAVRTLLRVESE